jgi:hypothetical protein
MLQYAAAYARHVHETPDVAPEMLRSDKQSMSSFRSTLLIGDDIDAGDRPHALQCDRLGTFADRAISIPARRSPSCAAV